MDGVPTGEGEAAFRAKGKAIVPSVLSERCLHRKPNHIHESIQSPQTHGYSSLERQADVSLEVPKALIKVLHKKRKEVIKAQTTQRSLPAAISHFYLFCIKTQTGFPASVGIWERR